MKVHIVSLYTLVFLILGSNYKINLCYASDPEDDIDIDDPSEAESINVDLIELNLNSKKTTDKFQFTKHGAKGELYTAKGHYRFNKVKSGGDVVWTPSREQYPNRVYYDLKDGKPHVKVIYSEDEFELPKVKAAAQPSKPAKAVKPVKAAPVKKKTKGDDFVELALPKTEDEDEVSVKVPRAAPVKHKVHPVKTAQPVAASHSYRDKEFTEVRMPPTEEEDNMSEKSFVEIALPATEDEESVPSRSTKLRATEARPSKVLPKVQKGAGFVQMALPRTDDEGDSPIRPTKTSEQICAPCVERGDGFVQMALPKTEDEDEGPPAHAPSKKQIVKVETVRSHAKAAVAHEAGRGPYPTPVRSGVEAGQSFLEFGIPPTEDEEDAPSARPVAGPNFLEFKLVSSSAEDEPGPAHTELPKSKAVVSAKFLDQPMPSSSEEESDDEDIENDEEVQFLLQFIEDMKIKIADLRRQLADMDAMDARASTL